MFEPARRRKDDVMTKATFGLMEKARDELAKRFLNLKERRELTDDHAKPMHHYYVCTVKVYVFFQIHLFLKV